MSGAPHVQVISIRMFESLFGLANGCQASCDHVIATYKVPCWTPQEANGETGRIGCKLLLGAGWKRLLLFVPAWTLAAKIQCSQNPSLHSCRELCRGRRKGHPPPCLLGSQQLKFKHAQSPKSLSPSSLRELCRDRKRTSSSVFAWTSATKCKQAWNPKPFYKHRKRLCSLNYPWDHLMIATRNTLSELVICASCLRTVLLRDQDSVSHCDH